MLTWYHMIYFLFLRTSSFLCHPSFFLGLIYFSFNIFAHGAHYDFILLIFRSLIIIFFLGIIDFNFFLSAFLTGSSYHCVTILFRIILSVGGECCLRLSGCNLFS